MSEPAVLVERDGHVVTVTLNRPEKRNAFNAEVLCRLCDAWDLIDGDDGVRVAILTGAGGGFSAGADLDRLVGALGSGKPPADEWEARIREDTAIIFKGFLKEYRTKKPLIAAVEGYCYAGGTEILQATDIRIAGEGACIAISEVQRGLFPMSASTIRLPRQVPWTVAMEILLTGEPVSAARAFEVGLVGQVVPEGKALERAREVAERIAANGPLAVQAVKAAVLATDGLSEADAIRKEMEIGMPVMASADAREGSARLPGEAGPELPRPLTGPGEPLRVDPGRLGGVELAFLSFTEITEDGAHRAYNEWHQLDHLPEQLPLPGVLAGRRWARTAACRRAGSSGPLLAPTHYLTVYLMTGPLEQSLRDFWSLAGDLRSAGRFFEQRRALLSGPFAVEDAGVAERVAVSVAALPHRPDRGVYVRVEQRAAPQGGTRGAPLASLISVPGVAGAWRLSAERRWPAFGDAGDVTVTVCWLDEDPLTVAPALQAVTEATVDEPTAAPTQRTGAPSGTTGTDDDPALEGPFVSVVPWRWDELRF